MFRTTGFLIFIMCSSYLARISLFPYLVRLIQFVEHTIAQLMHYAASLNVSVSIPDEVTGIFQFT
jgi:hypothetical protein